MKKALLNIDYTNDFVAKDGALTCGEPGQKIEQEMVRITEDFIKNGDYVVFAIDYHQKDDAYHPETKLYPPHNIEGETGRELYGELQSVYERNKDKQHVYWLDKTRYSPFVGTDLEIKLRERGITEVHLVGCATDICVLHAAVSAYNLGFDVVVHQHAVASFNPDGHEWALQHFENALGAEIIK
ncbi:cysteine hydrolase family protein [Lentibacillus sediminis]|uniref:cysteine hydrolase family protein n=1 Tax=Lentibacillus sediminis TaxID=1940529 RepID=UPI000C1BCFC6|nr:cysteine hydrolase family protein [Lentibacillus sediminis]